MKKRYEYWSVTRVAPMPGAELTEGYGGAGWRLVALVKADQETVLGLKTEARYVYYFEREKSEEEE